jgi:hypothetical protein
MATTTTGLPVCSRALISAWLVGRDRRLRVVAEALGVGLLADRDHDRVRRCGVSDRARLVRGVDDVGVVVHHAGLHRRTGRDHPWRPHAADVA